ncbi:MAG: hypothetical protein KGO81_03790 [Bacteroidota bacterium]|nr:hypothetical protein [Bacteroidota bacterium]
MVGIDGKRLLLLTKVKHQQAAASKQIKILPTAFRPIKVLNGAVSDTTGVDKSCHCSKKLITKNSFHYWQRFLF